MAADSPVNAWSRKVRLSDVQRGGERLELKADPGERERIARELDVEAVESLEADVAVRGWQDGLQADGRWRARVTQTCGVSLEPFSTDLSGDFEVRAVPADSPLAAYQEPEGDISLETPDPPDVLAEDDTLDVAALVTEHLSLEIDPYPRKPGVEWEAPEASEPESPFAVLGALKPRSDA